MKLTLKGAAIFAGLLLIVTVIVVGSTIAPGRY